MHDTLDISFDSFVTVLVYNSQLFDVTVLQTEFVSNVVYGCMTYLVAGVRLWLGLWVNRKKWRGDAPGNHSEDIFLGPLDLAIHIIGIPTSMVS